MAVDTPEIYIELFGASTCQPNNLYTATPIESFHPLDPTDYDGTVSYEFEVVGNAWAATNGNTDVGVALVDEEGNVYATIIIPWDHAGTGFELWRQRASFVPDLASKNYGVKFWRIDNSNVWLSSYYMEGRVQWYMECFISTARIIIRQIGATKTRIQIPMVGASQAYIGQASPTFHPQLPNGWAEVDEVVVPIQDQYSNSFGYSDLYLPIWKFEESELTTVKKVKWRCNAGYYNGLMTTKEYEIITSVNFDHFHLALYTSIPGLSNCLTATPTGWVEGGTYVDDCTGDTFEQIPNTTLEWDQDFDPYPDVLLVRPDFTYYESGMGIYVGGEFDGIWGHFEEWFTINFAPGAHVVDVNLLASIEDHEGTTHRYIRLLLTYFVVIDSYADMALFNRTDNTLVPGSELRWYSGETPSWKEAELDPVYFISGKEYELRGRSNLHYGHSYPIFSEPRYADAELYFYIDPIEKLTVWQRVKHGITGWGDLFMTNPAWVPCYWERFYPGSLTYPSSGYGMSRVKFYIPENNTASIAYELTSYIDPDSELDDGYGPPYPGTESWLVAGIYDCGALDTGGAALASLVPDSLLEWFFAIEGNDRDQDGQRHRKRTGSIDLLHGHEYISFFDDDSQTNLFPNNGFLIVSVTPSGPVPVDVALAFPLDVHFAIDAAVTHGVPACLGVSASINAATLLVTGSGTGINATMWRVIRRSDNQVMDSGIGLNAIFSFTGAYGVSYQLEYSANGSTWTGLRCIFKFPLPITCVDSPCVLCLPEASILHDVPTSKLQCNLSDRIIASLSKSDEFSSRIRSIPGSLNLTR